jgi:hypothetical protein
MKMKFKKEPDKMAALLEGSIDPMNDTPPDDPAKRLAVVAAAPVRPQPVGRPVPQPVGRPVPRPIAPAGIQPPATTPPIRVGPPVTIHVGVRHSFVKTGPIQKYEILPGSPVGQVGETHLGGLQLQPLVRTETGREYAITIQELPSSKPAPKPSPYQIGVWA